MLAVLVLDGLHEPLLERMLAEGRLPALASLRDAGERIALAGSAEYLEGSVHTTLHTGLEASSHGIYSPFQWSASDQRVRPRWAFPVPPAVWDRLGRAGRRSLLIDPYDCVPPTDLRGDALRGWQFTNRVALPPLATRTRRRLARRFGRAQPADEIYGRPDPSELLRLREVLLDAARRIADAAEELLAGQRYDLLWIDFAAMHLAGHQFFDVDAVAPTESLDRAELARLHTALEDVYVEGDRAIARVLERLPAGADVIVAAPSTMVAESDRSDMLPAMLAKIFGEAGEAEPEPGRLQLWRVRAAVPPSVRSRIARLVPDRVALELASRLLTAGNDWSRTRAFPVPNDPGGGIRFNLRGRERDGIVEESELDDLERELIAGLRGFRDPDGASSIEAIERPSELEPPGTSSSLLPDLAVRWRPVPAAGVDSVSSPEHGTVQRHGIGSGRSGNHTGGAWAILAPGGSRARAPDRPARIVDLAATVCSLLEAETDGLAGEPLLSR